MKFKAKPLEKMLDEDEYNNDWVLELLDDEGYVTGYLVENYLVGSIMEAHEEYITFEWWIPIDKQTLIVVITCDRCNNRLSDCECEYELSEG